LLVGGGGGGGGGYLKRRLEVRGIHEPFFAPLF